MIPYIGVAYTRGGGVVMFIRSTGELVLAKIVGHSEHGDAYHGITYECDGKTVLHDRASVRRLSLPRAPSPPRPAQTEASSSTRATQWALVHCRPKRSLQSTLHAFLKPRDPPQKEDEEDFIHLAGSLPQPEPTEWVVAVDAVRLDCHKGPKAFQWKVVSTCNSSRSSGAGPRNFTPSRSRSRSPYIGTLLKTYYAEFLRFMLQNLCLQVCVHGGSVVPRGGGGGASLGDHPLGGGGGPSSLGWGRTRGGFGYKSGPMTHLWSECGVVHPVLKFRLQRPGDSDPNLVYVPLGWLLLFPTL